MRALGAFVMTTVLFAAAMVIAHGLSIPDPERRFLPTTERNDSGDAVSEDAADDLALDTGNDLGTPQSLEEPPIPEVTAVPTPDDATGNSLRDDERENGSGSLTANDDESDDGRGDRDTAPDTGTNAADRDGGGTGTSDDPTDGGSPTASTPTPQPRSDPSPSPTPSEASEVAQPTQSSSLIVPGTDEGDHDRAGDDRHQGSWNPYWWEQDHDRRGDDRDGDRHDGDRHDGDDRRWRRR